MITNVIAKIKHMSELEKHNPKCRFWKKKNPM